MPSSDTVMMSRSFSIKTRMAIRQPVLSPMPCLMAFSASGCKISRGRADQAFRRGVSSCRKRLPPRVCWIVKWNRRNQPRARLANISAAAMDG